nr:MAG TPA: hypothetical protein [Caudoviricetes sp.]
MFFNPVSIVFSIIKVKNNSDILYPSYHLHNLMNGTDFSYQLLIDIHFHQLCNFPQ